MEIRVLGSSSDGNCYLIHNDNECLIVEAGISIKAVKIALDFNIRKIVGVLCSHEHGDHSKYLKDYQKAGIRTITPYISSERSYKVGNFIVMPFELVHDVPCYGFYISHPDCGTILYASDTEYIKWRFSGINYMLIEMNFDKSMVSEDDIKKSRVLQTHMEMQTTVDFLKANNSPDLKAVLLCHLSNTNIWPDTALEKAMEVLSCPVWIASKGLRLNT